MFVAFALFYHIRMKLYMPPPFFQGSHLSLQPSQPSPSQSLAVHRARAFEGPPAGAGARTCSCHIPSDAVADRSTHRRVSVSGRENRRQ